MFREYRKQFENSHKVLFLEGDGRSPKIGTLIIFIMIRPPNKLKKYMCIYTYIYIHICVCFAN